MKSIDCSTLFLPVLCRALGYYPSVFAQCITCTEDGKPIAGVVYDHYNPLSITAHIWIEDGKIPSREWFAAIFDYPFNRLHVDQIVGQVVESNTAAHRLDKHLGFSEAGRIKNYSPEGDLVFYTMKKSECAVLNSPRWRKVVNLVRVA